MAQQLFGIYRAIVVNVNDPLLAQRVQVQIPQILGGSATWWAEPTMVVPPALLPLLPMPLVGQQVFAFFIGGDPESPAYIRNTDPTANVTLPADFAGLNAAQPPYGTGITTPPPPPPPPATTPPPTTATVGAAPPATTTPAPTTGGGSPGTGALAGADWVDNFTSLDLSTANHEGMWLASSHYVGNALVGYMDEGSGMSWNANPNQSGNGITLNPFTISTGVDGATDGTVLGIHLRKYTGGQAAAAAAMGAKGGSRYGGVLIMNERVKTLTVGRYYEWRMRCPNPGDSMWPALWLYAAQDSGGFPAEIDMIEIAGWSNGNQTPNGRPWHITNHTDTQVYNVLHDITDKDTTNWHTYGVYWDYGKTIFYYDRTQIASWYGTYFDNKKMSARMNFTSTVNYEFNPPMPDDIRMEVDYFAYWGTGNSACPVSGK